jgi:hypothetical protein
MLPVNRRLENQEDGGASRYASIACSTMRFLLRCSQWIVEGREKKRLKTEQKRALPGPPPAG